MRDVLKDRRLWLLAPVLLALVLLLGFTRNRPAPSIAEVPPAGSARVASVPGPGAAAESTVDEDTPRHAQIGFRTGVLLQEHYRKHGREFHVRSASAYLRLAQRLR